MTLVAQWSMTTKKFGFVLSYLTDSWVDGEICQNHLASKSGPTVWLGSFLVPTPI